LIRQMRALLDHYDDRMMVGEIYLPFKELVKYYGAKLDECHLPFNFHLILASQGWANPGGWSAQKIRRLVEDYEAALPAGGWPNWVIGNHDQHRVASRVGAAQARVASMLLLTLRGTPTYYYGDEIGMENVAIPPEFVQDPPAVNQPELAGIVGRDPERTPMQWDAGPNAGFAAPGVRTWLPPAPDYPARNVAEESRDPTSMLSFFRALTRLRRAEPALNRGDYASLESGCDDVFSYLRTAEGSGRFLVALNFGAAEQTLDLSAAAPRAEVVLSTGMMRSGLVELKGLKLGPNEGLVLRM
jgi:alpha-glucosidase